MTLQQLHDLRCWHMHHRRDHPIENQAYEAVLTIWVMGWIGLPAALLLNQALVLASALAVLTPLAYVSLRLYLHRHHRLRCDWLCALGVH
jgi:hypothetical protein